jgi:hypothetical protein
MVEDSVMSGRQEGLVEHSGGPITLEGKIFCLAPVREDMEASWKPSAMTTTSTSTMTTIFGLEEKKHL